MRQLLVLIHLREQVTRKIRHTIGNLVEANHDPSKMRSSLLRVYEKRLGTYYQEYSNLHQVLLDRIPKSEFEEQDELRMNFDRLLTEALLRKEQVFVSLTGKYQLRECWHLVLGSFQTRQK